MTHLIAACCVLHNFCLNFPGNDDMDIEEPLVGQPQQQPQNHHAEATPLQYRDALTQFLAE